MISAKPDLFDQRRFMISRFARLVTIIARGGYDLKVSVRLEEEGDRLLSFDHKRPAEAGGMIDDRYTAFGGTVVATVNYKDLAINPAWMRSILPLLREDPVFVDVLGEALLAGKMNEWQRFATMFEAGTWRRVTTQNKNRHFGLHIVHSDTTGGYRLNFSLDVSAISRAFSHEMALAGGGD
jgi:hypothetical protein